MKLEFALIFMLAFVSGCAGLDSVMSTRGVLSDKASNMDGSRIVSMTPVLTNTMSPEFGLYWDTAKGDIALLAVQMAGAVNFDSKKPLEIKVDGKLISLPPANLDDYGRHSIEGDATAGYSNVSVKDFRVTKDQILEIANGKKTYYRIWLIKNEYQEGEVDYTYQDIQSFLPFSFRKFHSTVWGGNQ